MSAFLLFLLMAWGLTAAGRQIAAWLRLPERGLGDRTGLIGFALGLGFFAYAMLLLGLAHGFYPVAALLLVLLLFTVGLREHGRMAQGTRLTAGGWYPATPSGWAVTVIFALFTTIALSGVYAPPTLIEWDSIAYHLADPKIYVQAHRIYYLPWEDHSNFAFNLEMCYTFGLLFHSVPLAKFFHFACAVGLACATYRLGALLFSARIGLWGALLLASCPIVFWEAGTAYVDLAVTFYTIVTLIAVVHGIQENSDAWLGVSAVIMGLTLGTKGTALGVLGLLAVGLLIWRLAQRQGVGRSLGKTVLWCLIALAVGSPLVYQIVRLYGKPRLSVLLFGLRGALLERRGRCRLRRMERSFWGGASSRRCAVGSMELADEPPSRTPHLDSEKFIQRLSDSTHDGHAGAHCCPLFPDVSSGSYPPGGQDTVRVCAGQSPGLVRDGAARPLHPAAPAGIVSSRRLGARTRPVTAGARGPRAAGPHGLLAGVFIHDR